MTAAVWLIGTDPFTVALIVFTSAVVELNVPVICPFASVVPTGCVNVLFVPVEARATVAPWTRLLNASRTVTVIAAALAPLLAVIGLGLALTDDRLELGRGGVPVAVKITGLPVMPLGDAVAVSVFGPAIVLRVQDVTVATPSVPVATGVAGSTAPLLRPVANVTSTPDTGLPFASVTITEGGEATAVPAGAD